MSFMFCVMWVFNYCVWVMGVIVFNVGMWM